MEWHAPHRPNGKPSLTLWLAQGFGVGRSRFAPGTFGAMLGLVWFALLLLAGQAWLFILGSVGAVAVAVRVCGTAEKILGRKDAPSIVLDEVAAVPLCCAPLLVDLSMRHRFPDLGGFLAAWPWWMMPLVFLLFRVFDILKPWPIRHSQRLSGGWGVVADDILAAGWVNVIVGAAIWLL